jgi:flagellar L-ring protein precursor FlgH
MNSLTKKIAVCMLLSFLAAIFPAGSPVQAESLWNDQSNLFADHRARAVGDILTIVINEVSTAYRSGNASNSKSASASANAGTGIFHGIAAASTGSSDSFAAKGSLSNTNSVTATMTAQVTEVKPNGDLVITGMQSIKQNNEEQKITVQGVVRQDDIAADNTVLSSYIANAQIFLNGKGPIAGKQRQGILTQLFNFLF